jgi:CheY-like chemotaxis protein
MQTRPAVLIVDDDPTHLQIYCWIVEGAGYRSLSALVRFAGIDLPEGHTDLVLLDYHLNGKANAVEVAKLVRSRSPHTPIVLLSDVPVLPPDIAPFVQGFVRKGDPAKLVDHLHDLLRPTLATTASKLGT